ncbi:hypothetical protein AB1Y20_022530 [Prymnesium parvum]|uniref:UBA domain-containing protein n=1 Tax=Prymnesium parvum TaxID=97485 RepID=A0AB34JJN6_PRYPA
MIPWSTALHPRDDPLHHSSPSSMLASEPDLASFRPIPDEGVRAPSNSGASDARFPQSSASQSPCSTLHTSLPAAHGADGAALSDDEDSRSASEPELTREELERLFAEDGGVELTHDQIKHLAAEGWSEEELRLLAEDAGATRLEAAAASLALHAGVDPALEALAREDEEVRQRTAAALAAREEAREEWGGLAEGWREEQQLLFQQMLADAEARALKEVEEAGEEDWREEHGEARPSSSAGGARGGEGEGEGSAGSGEEPFWADRGGEGGVDQAECGGVERERRDVMQQLAAREAHRSLLLQQLRADAPAPPRASSHAAPPLRRDSASKLVDASRSLSGANLSSRGSTSTDACHVLQSANANLQALVRVDPTPQDAFARRGASFPHKPSLSGVGRANHKFGSRPSSGPAHADGGQPRVVGRSASCGGHACGAGGAATLTFGAISKPLLPQLPDKEVASHKMASDIFSSRRVIPATRPPSGGKSVSATPISPAQKATGKLVAPTAGARSSQERGYLRSA